MTDIHIAKDLLLKEAYSLVVVKDGQVLATSRERGLKPILSILSESKDKLKGAVVADKIVGKAAALLSIYGGITEAYAQTLSDCAKTTYHKYDIKIESSRVVPYIINREGSDKCPMEKLVENIENPEEAYKVILSYISKNLGK